MKRPVVNAITMAAITIPEQFYELFSSDKHETSGNRLRATFETIAVLFINARFADI